MTCRPSRSTSTTSPSTTRVFRWRRRTSRIGRAMSARTELPWRAMRSRFTWWFVRSMTVISTSARRNDCAAASPPNPNPSGMSTSCCSAEFASANDWRTDWLPLGPVRRQTDPPLMSVFRWLSSLAFAQSRRQRRTRLREQLPEPIRPAAVSSSTLRATGRARVMPALTAEPLHEVYDAVSGNAARLA